MLSSADQTCTHTKRKGLDFEVNTLFAPLQKVFKACGALGHPSFHVCVTQRPSGKWKQDERIKKRCTIGMLGTNELPNTHMCSPSNVHTHAHWTKWLNLLHRLPAGSPAQPSLAGSILRLPPQELKWLHTLQGQPRGENTIKFYCERFFLILLKI